MRTEQCAKWWALNDAQTHLQSVRSCAALSWIWFRCRRWTAGACRRTSVTGRTSVAPPSLPRGYSCHLDTGQHVILIKDSHPDPEYRPKHQEFVSVFEYYQVLSTTMSLRDQISVKNNYNDIFTKRWFDLSHLCLRSRLQLGSCLFVWSSVLILFHSSSQVSVDSLVLHWVTLAWPVYQGGGWGQSFRVHSDSANQPWGQRECGCPEARGSRYKQPSVKRRL